MSRKKGTALAAAFVLLLCIAPPAWGADGPEVFQDWEALTLGWWTGTLNSVLETLDLAIQSWSAEPEYTASSCQKFGSFIEPCGQEIGGATEPYGQELGGHIEPRGEGFGEPQGPPSQEIGGAIEPYG